MALNYWILISIIIFLIILGFLAFIVRRKDKSTTDYYALFTIGLIWLPFGIIMDNYLFTVMGIILMSIGLANKNKWKKNKNSWSNLSDPKRKIMKAILILLGFFVFVGLAFIYLSRRGLI